MTDRDNALSLEVAQAAEEFTAAIEAGEQPNIDDFVRRFPAAGDVLRTVLPAIISLTGNPSSARYRKNSTGSETVFSDADPFRLPHLKQLGDFQLEEPIGQGGMGVVYRATQLSIGRVVAVKVLPFAATLDSTQLQRFRNEVRAAGTLNHPNIVPIYAMGEQRGVYFYAMQLIQGCSLAELIAALNSCGSQPNPGDEKVLEDTIAVANALEVTRPMDGKAAVTGEQSSWARQVATLGRQAAFGLSHAHACGVTHRDIKPANLMIDTGGKLWITDFGLAHVESGQTLTMPGDFIGTLRYMSPEQAAGLTAQLDHRADIYSLGVSLYELLTGQTAIAGETREQIINAVMHAEPTPPRKIDSAISIELETIIMKACEKHPHDRYATAAAFAEDLDRFLDDKPISARRRTSIENARRWTNRNTFAVLTTSAVTMLIAGIILSATLWIWHERTNTENSILAEQAERSRKEETLRAARYIERIYLQEENNLRNEGGMTPKRRKVLQEVLRFYESLPKTESEKPQLRFDSAKARRRLGDVNQHLGRFIQSQKEYTRAIYLLDSLVQADPINNEYASLAAVCQTQLGVVLSRMGNNVEACNAYQTSLELLDRIENKPPPSNPEWSHQLLAASTIQLLADSLVITGQQEQALTYSDQAMESAKTLVEKYALEPEVRHQVIKIAQSHANLVFRIRGVGNPDRDIVKNMDVALQWARTMQERFPNEAASAALVAKIACDYSLLCDQLGMVKQSTDLVAESIEIYKGLATRFPHRPALLVEESNAHDRYAGLLHDQKKYNDAIKQYRIAIELDERAAQVDGFERSLTFRKMAIGKQQNLSNTLWRTRNVPGRKDECRQIRERIVPLWKSLTEDYPDQPDLAADYAMALYGLAELKAAADAIKLVSESIDGMKRLTTQHPDTPAYRSRLTTCLNALAGHYARNNEWTLAVESAQSAIQVAEALTEKWPSVPDHHGKVARRYRLLGRFYLYLNENEKAAAAFVKAMAARKHLRALSDEYSTSMFVIPEASLHVLLAAAYRRINASENDIQTQLHFDTAARMAVGANAMKALAEEIHAVLNSQERELLLQFIAQALEERY